MGYYLQDEPQPPRHDPALGRTSSSWRRWPGRRDLEAVRFEFEILAENKTKIPFDGLLGEKVTVQLKMGDESTRART